MCRRFSSPRLGEAVEGPAVTQMAFSKDQLHVSSLAKCLHLPFSAKWQHTLLPQWVGAPPCPDVSGGCASGQQAGRVYEQENLLAVYAGLFTGQAEGLDPSQPGSLKTPAEAPMPTWFTLPRCLCVLGFGTQGTDLIRVSSLGQTR